MKESMDEESIDDSIVSINKYYSQLSRPSWDEYFLFLAFNISLRSEDPDIKLLVLDIMGLLKALLII